MDPSDAARPEHERRKSARSTRHIEASSRFATLPASPDPSISFRPELVEAFLLDFTLPGDVVFDPFAGYGTTLLVAESMDRRAVGLELLDDRAEYIRAAASAEARVLTGDARALKSFDIGPVDFVITSPPYMTFSDHLQNPLTGYQTLDGDYDRYLDELRGVFADLVPLLGPDAHVVVNVANLGGGDTAITPLAWDVGRVLSTVLHFENQVQIISDRPDTTVAQDYCLVFRTHETFGDIE